MKEHLLGIALIWTLQTCVQGIKIRSPATGNEDNFDLLSLREDEVDIAKRLKATMEETRQLESEFLEKFREQQDVLAEVNGVTKGLEARFAQLKAGSSADPQQIWRGLYDTQPKRGPPQMTVNIFDGEDGSAISDQASSLGAEASAARVLASIQQEADQMKHEAQASAAEKTIANEYKSLQGSVQSAMHRDMVPEKPSPTRAFVGVTRDGPRQEAVMPAKVIHHRAEPKQSVVGSSRIACAGMKTVPLFRAISQMAASRPEPKKTPTSENTQNHHVQVVSPFVPTVGESDKSRHQPEPEMLVSAGYYGPSRLTM